MSHTKGPWQFDRGAKAIVNQVGLPICFTLYADDYIGNDPDGDSVAEWESELAANRQLLAAAPDLLAALIAVVRVADRATVEFDAARAAIAKATGTPTTKGPNE